MNSNSVQTQISKIAPWDEGAPVLHSPLRYGARVNNSFYLPVACVGARPLVFSAEGLPRGLNINPGSGIITGKTEKEGEYQVLLNAENIHGKNVRELNIVIGETLALTPPLGWSSWNCFGSNIDAQKIMTAAKAMVSSGMAAHGYTYVNIDDGWQGERDPESKALQSNRRFPDMKNLCDFIHSLGLKAGIYSTPWVKSYAGHIGGSDGECVRCNMPDYKYKGLYFGEHAYHYEDAAQWAEWGFDYLKYDWTKWELIEIKDMYDALRACGRDIIYSLSNNGPIKYAAEFSRYANCWRTTKDITDHWEDTPDYKGMSCIGFTQDKWVKYAGPGHWNDPDMLVVGQLGWPWDKGVGNLLTRDEQITHITLWSILAAPLLAGCDLSKLDDFTVRLLCNDEVLAINQDPLGKQGHCVKEIRQTDEQGEVVFHTAVYKRHLYNGDIALAFFNRSEFPNEVEIEWKDLKITGTKPVRDVWANKNLGKFAEGLFVEVPAHGAQYFLVRNC